jgi:hypothetical protein
VESDSNDDEISIAVNPAPSTSEGEELSVVFAEAGHHIDIGQINGKIFESVSQSGFEVWISTPSLNALVGGAAVGGVVQLGKLIRETFRAMRHRGAPGVISMGIQGEKVVAVFHPDLPDIAYKKLLTEPIPRHDKSAEIEWDDEHQQWRDRLDSTRPHFVFSTPRRTDPDR